MKLGIIGSRTLNQKNVKEIISQVVSKSKNTIDEIVTGGANGVDSIAEFYAKQNHIKCSVFLPQYETYGKRAPLIRNNVILENSDAILAIWDGESKGTLYTINRAKKLGLKVMVVNLDPSKKYNDNIWNNNAGRLPKKLEAIKR
jgi:predicted Rossmann fold nucleotide-binding protein DprA/Smf involved in DNA uptake